MLAAVGFRRRPDLRTLLLRAGGAALVGYAGRPWVTSASTRTGTPETGHWLVGMAAALVVGVLTRSRPVRIGSATTIGLFVVVTAALRHAG